MTHKPPKRDETPTSFLRYFRTVRTATDTRANNNNNVSTHPRARVYTLPRIVFLLVKKRIPAVRTSAADDSLSRTRLSRCSRCEPNLGTGVSRRRNSRFAIPKAKTLINKKNARADRYPSKTEERRLWPKYFPNGYKNGGIRLNRRERTYSLPATGFKPNENVRNLKTETINRTEGLTM